MVSIPVLREGTSAQKLRNFLKVIKLTNGEDGMWTTQVSSYYSSIYNVILL